jgi:signal transduction histidine kinase
MAVAATAATLIIFDKWWPVFRFLIAAGISSAAYFTVWGLTALHVSWLQAAIAAVIPALVTFGAVRGNAGEEDDGGSGCFTLAIFEGIYSIALYGFFHVIGGVHSVFHLYADLAPLIGIPFAFTLTKPLVGYLAAGSRHIGRKGRLAKERVEWEESKAAAAFEEEKARTKDAIENERREIARMIDEATREGKKRGE